MAPLSRRAGLDPNVFQNYISDAPWSDAKIQRINIRALHEERLVDPNAVIAFDDTGFPKQGVHSPGVGRQYSGTLDRVLHHGTVIHVKGESYRLRERRRLTGERPGASLPVERRKSKKEGET